MSESESDDEDEEIDEDEAKKPADHEAREPLNPERQRSTETRTK